MLICMALYAWPAPATPRFFFTAVALNHRTGGQACDSLIPALDLHRDQTSEVRIETCEVKVFIDLDSRYRHRMGSRRGDTNLFNGAVVNGDRVHRVAGI